MPRPATRKNVKQAARPANDTLNEAKRHSDATSAFDNILSSVYTTEEALTEDVKTVTQTLRNLSQERSRIKQRYEDLATLLEEVERALSAYGRLAFPDATDAQSPSPSIEHQNFVSSILEDIETYTTRSSSAKADTRTKEIDAEIEEGKLHLIMLLGIQSVAQAGGLKRARAMPMLRLQMDRQYQSE